MCLGFFAFSSQAIFCQVREMHLTFSCFVRSCQLIDFFALLASLNMHAIMPHHAPPLVLGVSLFP